MAIIIYDIARIKRIPIDFMRLFNVFFLISYIISPIFHIILFSQLQDELYIINGITLYRSTPSMPIIIATAYLSIVIGYQITSSTASLQIAVNERMRYNIHIIILFFMIFLMLIYTSNFGGIIPWIKSSISARMSRIETENAGGLSFLYTIFRPAAIPILYVAYASLIHNRNSRNIILFIISLFYFIIIAIGHGGRGLIIFGLIGIFIIHFNAKGRIHVFKILISSVFLFATIVYGKPALTSLSLAMQGWTEEAYIRFYSDISYQNERFLIEILRYVSHPANSLAAYLNNIDAFQFRYFTDILHSVNSIIPSRLLGINKLNIVSLTEINSDFLSGNPGQGIIPGQLALWVHAFGPLGVVICGLWWGAIMRWLQDVILNSAKIQKGFLGIHAALIIYFSQYIQIGMPSHMVTTLAVYVLSLIILSPFIVFFWKEPRSLHKT